MSPPPTKKQKRLTVSSSNDNSEAEKHLPVPPVQSESVRRRAVGTVHQALDNTRILPTRSRDAKKPVIQKPQSAVSAAPSKSLPEQPLLKPKKRRKSIQEDHKQESLYTFFNAVTQSQRFGANLEDATSQPRFEEEDFIQDDSLADDLRTLPLERNSEKHVVDGRKRSRTLSSSHEAPDCKEIQPNASQRFNKTVRRQEHTQHAPAAAKADLRPWAEIYAPTSLDELAVHKKKVADVRNCLEDAFLGRNRKRLLILKGPSGTGKTATLSALARTMSFDVVEWRNPVGIDYASESFLSLGAQFEEFLRRCGKFDSLQFETTDNTTQVEGKINFTSGIENQKKIILIEEFPNTFTRTSNALHSFRSCVIHYLAANTPSLDTSFVRQHGVIDSVTPLVMVISETLLTTAAAAADSFTAHRLLGPEILTHPGVSVIEFNPIAPTFLANALDLVIQKEARQSGRRKIPGVAMLKKLGEVGDIRSAIGSLEFLCVRGDNGSDWGGRVATKARKGVRNLARLTKMEKESIETVTQREATLGIFHAVGKVVYNKRDALRSEDPLAEPLANPPDHLSHLARPLSSQVSVDELIDETGTDAQTFIAALHENYILSCHGSSFIADFNGCIEALSDSDLLGSGRNDGYRGPNSQMGLKGMTSQGGASNDLRQDEICFQTAVRGILFALPYPVKRRASSATAVSHSSGKGDVFKMFYPTSLRLWKLTEEIEGLVNRWTGASMSRNRLHEGIAIRPLPLSGSVETWSGKTSNLIVINSRIDERIVWPLIGGNSARTEMLLERLPYIIKIEHQTTNDYRLRELEKMTQFHGVDAPTDNMPEEEEDNGAVLPVVTEWAAYNVNKTNTGSRQRTDGFSYQERRRKQGLDLPVQVGGAVEKLVLIDDDIEDD